jgi:hypothetical protein
MRIPNILVAMATLVSTTAMAADLTVTVEIPRMNVAEYHRPYVAIWVERADQSVALNLTHWYDLTLKNGEGTKWLKDMRQWWRRSGRDLDVPIDGISAATRPVGEHTLEFKGDAAPLSGLVAGDYQLVVEAAREVGGRELLKLPFVWPPTEVKHANIRGATELGRIAIDLIP